MNRWYLHARFFKFNSSVFKLKKRMESVLKKCHNTEVSLKELFALGLIAGRERKVWATTKKVDEIFFHEVEQQQQY